jgi:WXXGXW repeat (2 copies)
MRSIRFFMAALVLALVIPAVSYAQVRVGIAVSFGPPVIPVYEQPICPADGYLWTPGYWAWDPDAADYYWVPGTWVMAPEVGFLWTPGYWGWGDGGFFWNEGFWGPTIGFYGGINYGFGYFGTGFYGGRWDHDHFFYNRAVMRIDETRIHNVYETRVENINEGNRVSYNGGEGGLRTRPTPEEERAASERHAPPTDEQTHHAQTARSNPDMRAKANHGDPPVKATARAGDFGAHGEAGARAGASGGGTGGDSHSYNHAKELPPLSRPEPASSDATKAEKNYQKQQQKLYDQQQKERDKLAQQQEKEHAKKLNDAQHQQMEQRHQQQTQQLQQHHQQQQQELQQRAPAPHPSSQKPR